MILFQKDFVEQGAIVDYNTTNTSFIKMAMLLKEMGIKNNKFMLALYNTRLQGVNPYDPNLSEEMKVMITCEIKLNPWYYIREVVRITSQGTEGGVPFCLDRANLSFFWLYMNSINIFETIPRQIGKSIAAITLTSWILYFAGINVTVGMFARGSSLQVENVKRLKDIRDSLPSYLIRKNKNGIDSDNKEGVTYTALNTRYKTYTAQSEIQSAIDQGRGETFAITHWDEFAFYKLNWLSYPAAISTTDRASEQLQATGVPTCNIITTTAGRLDEKRGKYAFKVKSDCIQFTEHFYDCKDHAELGKLVEDNSDNGMAYIEYSYKQLGKDDAWLKKKIANKDPDVIQMDYFNRWISGSTEGVVPSHLLEKINNSLMEPKHVTMVDQVRVLWYVDKDTYSLSEFKNRPFVIACDTSDNMGRDYTTILILDPTDMRVIATARSNSTNLIVMAKSILKLMQEFPNSIFIPERNKNGVVFIDLILTEMEGKSFRPLRRIYNTVVQNFYDGKDPVDTFDIRGEGRAVFGFNTTASSRDILVKQVLFNTLNINYSKIYDQELISEICGLRLKNGRIDHGSEAQEHDDLLFAYLLASWLILFGKNLHYYGIDERIVLSKMDRQGNPIEAGEKDKQIQIQKRLVELDILIYSASSETLRRGYEVEKRDLERLVDNSIIDPNTISVSQVKKEKQDIGYIDIYDFEKNQKIWLNMF